MSRGENSVSITIDLINEIFSRLPAKSVMLARSYFKELFFTRSSARPLTADFHMKLPKDAWTRYEKHAFGLVYFCGRMGMVIFKPSTGQLGDPVDEQFKVLSKWDQILTLGTNDSWEEIYCPLNDLSTDVLHEGICINGVLHYFATQNAGRSYMIVCFDEFKFITYRDFIHEYDYNPWDLDSNNSKGRKCSLKLYMSVIRDVEDSNSEWSEHVYTFRKTNQCVSCNHVSTLWENQIVYGDVYVVGVAATCDVVLCIEDASKPLYVFYLNIKRYTLQRVEFRTPPNHEEAF
ncbi:hypothetical protein N665_0603s0018 [Sinapis alba]|nr:hypothetical protein N665_0603s0018 [Sinapis alba]